MHIIPGHSGFYIPVYSKLAKQDFGITKPSPSTLVLTMKKRVTRRMENTVDMYNS